MTKTAASTLPQFVKRTDLRRLLGGVAPQTIDLLVRNGTLPQPVRISERVVLFRADEVEAALARMQRAAA